MKNGILKAKEEWREILTRRQSSFMILIITFVIIIRFEDTEIEIRKQNGETAAFDAEKVYAAM